jgi:hypothetical protein
VRHLRPRGIFYALALGWIGIQNIGRWRSGGVDPRVVPVRRPCPERTPGSPAPPPNPNETNATAPTAAAPAPVPAGPSPPVPAAVPAPTTVPIPVVSVPGSTGGDGGSTTYRPGHGCVTHCRAGGAERMPLAVGDWRVIHRGSYRTAGHRGCRGSRGRSCGSRATRIAGVTG